jgi:16S rRNA (cytosine967-C5)-methyltransferase
MIYTQEIAAEVLQIVDETLLSEKEALKKRLSKLNLDYKIRASIHAYVFETEKRKNVIDYIISKSLKGKKVEELDALLRNLLRVGVYEMHFKGVHPALATDSIVRIVKRRFGEKHASLANAVLRRAEHVDIEKELEKIKKKDKIRYLALKYFHPEWFVETAIELLGEEEAIKLMIANNEKQSVYIRVNELKSSIEAVRRYLEQNGVELAETPLPDVFKVVSYERAPASLDWHDKGYYVIQDLASAFVAHVLKPEPDDVVLDLASAPGLKASHISAFMENRGKIIAVDNSEDRLRRMKAKMKVLGAKNIVYKLADGTKFFVGDVDKVLVDPPCSSTGSFRNYPCVKWRFDERKYRETIKVQRRMIKNAFRNLKSGGTLVYSTCSITFDENEENILFASTLFKIEEVEQIVGTRGIKEFRGREFPFWDKVVRTWTHLHDCTGFFISKLKKV